MRYEHGNWIPPNHQRLRFLAPERSARIVVRGHPQISNLIKGEATKQLVKAGVHPCLHLRREDGFLPPCWGRNCWKVFIDNVEHLQSAIQYVERNPEKEAKPRQNWTFVSPY